ncbi:MAG: HEAT repeat domain-containing protein [Gemmatimonadaceae bacterium]
MHGLMSTVRDSHLSALPDSSLLQADGAPLGGSAGSGAPVGAALSREVADFLVELTTAVQNYTIFPDGHPLAPAAAFGLMRRLEALLVEQPLVSFRVAPSQLLLEGGATDPQSLVLRQFAQKLHRRGIGAVKFLRGVEPAEVTDALRSIARDFARPGSATLEGEQQPLRMRWPHVQLFPLHYEQRDLLDSTEIPDAEWQEWANRLWLGLARVALAGDLLNVNASMDPVIMAKAIDSTRAAAYDREIVSYLMQLFSEIRTKGGAEATALQHRLSQMVDALAPATRGRLLEMEGNADRRKAFLAESSQLLAVDTLISMLRAGARASEQSLSTASLTLLSKLAAHSRQGSEMTRALSEAALRESVRGLVAGWRTAGDGIAGEGEPQLLGARESVERIVDRRDNGCEPERVVQMSLEIGVHGAAAEEAIQKLVREGKIAFLLDALDATPDASESGDALRARLSTEETLRMVLRSAPLDVRAMVRIVPWVGLVSVPPLLDALEAAKERTSRWKLLDAVAQFGSAIGPILVSRLDGGPWFMQRNLLLLIGKLPAWPDGFTPSPFLAHPDERVRREALKLLLRNPITRARAIVQGLADSDDRMMRLALSAATEQGGCPEEAVPRLVSMVTSADTPIDVQLQAIRGLATSRAPAAVGCLLDLCAPDRQWFRRRSLPPCSPQLLAALSGLALHARSDPRVTELIELAASHSDPEVRSAVNRPGAES